MAKIVIHRGTLTKTTTTQVPELEDGYEYIEVTRWTWFLYNHGILWMSICTLPFFVSALVCWHKVEKYQTAWVLGSLGMAIMMAIISFCMVLSACKEIEGEE